MPGRCSLLLLGSSELTACDNEALPPKPPGTKRLVLISDTHERHESLRLPSGDILLHCGDIFDTDGLWPRSDSLRRLEQFRQWCSSQPFQRIVLIGGNHDVLLDGLGQDETKRLLHPISYIEDEVIDVCGIRIWGCPCCPGVCDGLNSAFAGADAAARLVAVPCNIDVVMTHMHLPWGSKRLTDHVGAHLDAEAAILRSGASMNVCGHIHTAYGLRLEAQSTYHTQLTVVNCSIDGGPDGREPFNLPVVVDLPLQAHLEAP